MIDQSIDIIVPSYRLNETVLLNIIHLPKPVGYAVNIFVVADNPKVNVPLGIQLLHKQQQISLIINKTNLGFSATRNKGISAGNSHWILLLDDDIEPDVNLLQAYVSGIEQNTNAIGFVGVTKFPAPFNNATKALKLSGITAHFENAMYVEKMRWAPTANIMLNRNKLDMELFDANLKAGGEDIDFLVRNSLIFNERYISVPTAVVTHPWWNDGKLQTKRLIRYGIAASDIIKKTIIKQYAYYDFTNTSENILLLVAALPFLFFVHKAYLFLYLLLVVIGAEVITIYIKTIIIGKIYSPLIALYLTWIKNCREAGQLYGILSGGYLKGFAQRIELGFAKPNPSPFRLNKWKIIKMLLILVSIVLLITI